MGLPSFCINTSFKGRPSPAFSVSAGEEDGKIKTEEMYWYIMGGDEASKNEDLIEMAILRKRHHGDNEFIKVNNIV
ncbi:hypothetical protein RDI58_014478 [Solanum bulbocastanum]|uniref:Uncharacterized protein n=1 Tax=Solanum bulbocastanum TaxID=147425 RepID=A0AAN8YDZ3_SOLBU